MSKTLPRAAAVPRGSREGVATGAAIVATLLIWGSTSVFTKVAVAHVDGLSVGILRTLLAACVAVPYALAVELPRPGTRREVALAAGSALGAFVAFPLLFSLGLRFTTVVHAALIFSAAPIFTGLIAAWFDRTMPSRVWVAGVSLALLGEALLILTKSPLGARTGGLGGDLLVLLSTVGASAGYVCGGKLAALRTALIGTVWSLFVGGALMLPLAAVFIPRVPWQNVPGAGFASIAFLGIAGSFVAYLTWYWALSRGGIARVGLSQFAQPVVSVVLAIVLLHEVLTPLTVVATAAILGGIMIARR